MKKQITTMKRHILLAAIFFCNSLFLSAQVYKTVNLTSGGTLGTVLTSTEISTVTDLTVTTAAGVYLAAADFTTMNSMTVLANLDLSGSSLASTVTGTIPASAFLNKTSLKSFKFPMNVKYIGASAFSGSGLTGIFTIPATIDGFANIKARFDNCYSITAFSVGSGSTTLKAVDGVLFTYNGTSLVIYPLGKPGTAYNVPEGVTDIGYRAFKVCSLAYVELPSSLSTIQGEAFSGCTSLKQLICKATTPPNILDNSTFFTTSSVAGILVGVPDASLTAYQSSKLIATVYAAGKGFTTTQLVAYRNITLGDKVTCTQTLGIPTKSISVTAGMPDVGYSFSNWAATPAVTFASTTNLITTFIMPASDVTIQAVYAIPAWTGSGNWSNASNWSTGSLPATASNIIVSNGELQIDQNVNATNITVLPGAKLTLNSGKTLTATTLNLNSDATGTSTFINTGISTIGIANVQQYLTNGRNWYVSSPVSGATTSTINTLTGSSMVSYDEVHGTSAPWVTENSTLTAGKGYIVVSPINTNPTVTFSGTLNTDSKSIPVTRTVGQTKEGFNLVGNPYPAHLAWTEAIATASNVLPSIWYRTAIYNNSLSKYDYSFITYNAPSGVSVPLNGSGGFIPPMQAFWVRANVGGGILSFNNSMCSHSSVVNLLKAPAAAKINQQILRLQVSTGTNNDETVLCFNPNASNDYDGYDSPKMTNANVAIPEIYTLVGTEKLVINGLNSITSNEELSLGFTTGQSNLFTIKVTQFSNFESSTKVYLRDKALNIEQELTGGEAYNFSSDVASTNTRFSVLFKSGNVETGTNSNPVALAVLIYKNAGNQITVNCKGDIANNAIVSVYNSVGQKLQTKKITSPSIVIGRILTSGIYLVSINNGGSITTQKVILN